MANENSFIQKYFWQILSITLLSVVGVFVGYNFYAVSYPDLTKLSDLGDSFNSINTLFSGLAFAAIIIAIFLQREDLRIAKADLEESKRELRNQNKILDRQLFENTFFNLVELQNSKIRDIEIKFRNGAKPVRNHLIYKEAMSIIYGEYRDSDITSKNYSTVLKKLVKEIHARINSEIEPHVRQTLFNYEYVDKNIEDLDKKREYFDILASQVTHNQVAYIYYMSRYYNSNNEGLEFLNRCYFFAPLFQQVKLAEDFDHFEILVK